MKDFLIVGFGGFIGTMTRYGVYLISAKHFADKPYSGTLIVNLAGCLLIGLIGGSTLKANSQLSLFLIVGLCGGFTTFSTFALDGLKLLKAGLITQFFLYASISMVGGLALCLVGIYAGNKF